MKTVADDDPMGDDYWTRFDTEDEQVGADRIRRDSVYGGKDPGTWGWHRPNPADLQAQRIALRVSAAPENTSQQE